MPETTTKPIIEVAPYGRGRRFTWRVTLPKTKDLTGRMECNSRDVAMRFALFIADQCGWHVHEWRPEQPAEDSPEAPRG